MGHLTTGSVQACEKTTVSVGLADGESGVTLSSAKTSHDRDTMQKDLQQTHREERYAVLMK